MTSFPVGGPGWLGQVGASGSDRIMMARPSFASGDTTYFLYVAFVTLLAILLVEAHRRTKRRAAPGRVIRKSEQMAMASGVRIVFYKAWAFALAGFLAGMSGAMLAGLFGQSTRAVSRRRIPSWSASSARCSAAPSSGSARSSAASSPGFVPALLIDFNVNATVSLLFFGAVLMQALTVAPEGIGGQMTALADLLYRKFMARRS